MKLVNSKYPSYIDIYNVKINDLQYNIDKFKELVSLSQPKLDKSFSYRDRYTRYMLHGKSPLRYPISTLLLATFLPEYIGNYVDGEMAEYIYKTFLHYDPDDLYAVYNMISNDKNILRGMEESALDNYLKEKYEDIYILKDIFKHLDFTYLGSVNIYNLDKYISKHPTGVISNNIYQSYILGEDARDNSYVIKTLHLTPNKTIN